MAFLQRWLPYPPLKDEEQTRRARLLRWILVIGTVLNLFDMVVLALAAPETISGFWINALFLAATGLAAWLLRHGRVDSGSLLVGLAFWGLVSLYMTMSGGVTSPSFGLLSVIILLGGILLGVSGAIGFGGLAVVTAVILLIASNNGLLEVRATAPTPGRILATQVVIFASLAVLVAMDARSVRDALTRAQSGEKTLAERNIQLQGEIAERERAQQEHTRLAAILEATPDLVGISDAAGNLLYLNPAGRRLMALDDSINIRQTRVQDYHSPAAADNIMNHAFPIAMRDGTWTGETTLLTHDRREIPISQVLIAHRGTDGTVQYLSTIIRDIRERQQAEQQRLELALQDERLESFQELIANISHDIRTPLTVINNTLYLLERTEDADKRKEKIELIRQQSHLMEKFIQDLLLLSRLDQSPQLSLTQVDINSLLRQVHTSLLSAAEQKHITFQCKLAEDIPAIAADEGELIRLFTNLMENAVNYTPDGGTVVMKTSLMNEGILAEVSDTGIGITPDNLTNIFERFFRTDEARRVSAKGTGLGLAIVKRIVEMHGGTIDVDSQPGAGTTFRVWLPTKH